MGLGSLKLFERCTECDGKGYTTHDIDRQIRSYLGGLKSIRQEDLDELPLSDKPVICRRCNGYKHVLTPDGFDVLEVIEYYESVNANTKARIGQYINLG